MSDHPELLKQLALEVIDRIPLDAAKIYSDGNKGETNTTGSGFLRGLGLRGNEVADDLAKIVRSNPVDPEDHMVFTLTEIYFRAKELICRNWVVPLIHPWYFQRQPGSTISFKDFRSYQTAFSRFSSGHLNCMNF
ncbi:RNase H domain-containing protein [Trichonephila clavipes]|uniref:RNase H domain-containing protein n=1 Tax=Trichonephila clavipes TaxID=2585209 RepID=A0A8X6WBR9_TRICX|nr:RNase H domain-containing protein [Trichonephila clavipes]